MQHALLCGCGLKERESVTLLNHKIILCASRFSNPGSTPATVLLGHAMKEVPIELPCGILIRLKTVDVYYRYT